MYDLVSLPTGSWSAYARYGTHIDYNHVRSQHTIQI